MTTETGEYPALRKLVMIGVTTKRQARDALEELTALIEALEGERDELDNGLADWEEGDDAELRAEGKETVEGVATNLDTHLTNAGRACGMADYEPEDAS